MSEPRELWDYPRPHVLRKRVAASDMDGLGHTNNAVYVTWCGDAAWSHSLALGLDLERFRALDRAMVITRSEFDYLRPSRAGDDVAVGTWIVSWDRRLTMERRFQVLREGDGATLLRAVMWFACVELSSGRPRRLPPAFIDGYGPAVLAQGGDRRR